MLSEGGTEHTSDDSGHGERWSSVEAVLNSSPAWACGGGREVEAAREAERKEVVVVTLETTRMAETTTEDGSWWVRSRGSASSSPVPPLSRTVRPATPDHRAPHRRLVS